MNNKIQVEKINLSVKGLKPFNIKFDLSKTKSVPFQIDGQFPTYISKINNEGLDNNDIKLGDYIIEINGQNISRASRRSVQKLINKCLNNVSTLNMLVYRRQHNKNSKLISSNKNDLSTNTIQEPVNFLSCFKKALFFKNKNKTKTSNSINKFVSVTINANDEKQNVDYAQIEILKTNKLNKKDTLSHTISNKIQTTKIDNIDNDTDDCGYYSIPQESNSQVNEISFLNTSTMSSNQDHDQDSKALDQSILNSVELFINKLQNLIEVYIRPLIALNILNQREYLTLFGNMEKLVPVTKYLANAIQSNDISNSLKIVFETFNTYLVGLPNSIQLLDELLADHDEFYLFLKTLKDSCKMALFDFIFLPFKFVHLISSYFNQKSTFNDNEELFKLNKTLKRTVNFLNEITSNDDNNSTILTENSIKIKSSRNNNEVLFKDDINFKVNDEEWKKAKVLLFNNKMIILNKKSHKIYKKIKLNNIKTIKSCSNSNLDIDLVISEYESIKLHFNNMLSKNIWFQLTQIQLNYSNC